jgi:hypothetical protein
LPRTIALVFLLGCTRGHPDATPADSSADTAPASDTDTSSTGFFSVELVFGEVDVQLCRYLPQHAITDCDVTLVCDGAMPEGGFGDIILSDGTTTATLMQASNYAATTGVFAPGATLIATSDAWQTSLVVPIAPTVITAPASGAARPIADPLDVAWTHPSDYTRAELDLQTDSGGVSCLVDASLGDFTMSPAVLARVGVGHDELCITPTAVGVADLEGWHIETVLYGNGNCQSIDLQ